MDLFVRPRGRAKPLSMNAICEVGGHDTPEADSSLNTPAPESIDGGEYGTKVTALLAEVMARVRVRVAVTVSSELHPHPAVLQRLFTIDQ